ncbi:MAG TPA: molybdate ABC transporter substrate-binding protein [Actinomycetota bacterium]|nr:molybdate ABC transporter substrate-binding protein [Actinomycetota bacterium]
MSRALAVIACLTLLLPACGGSGSERQEVTVLAAASLTGAFTRIGAEFEQANRDVTVRFSFGPSDGLATQILEGAPADVFAPASPKYMDQVRSDGPGVTDQAEFARNTLAVIVPSDNPAHVGSLDDLARPGVKLVLAAVGVPAGEYARGILANAGIQREALTNVVSNEEDVKGVVQKVLLGEADAGIVYRTDVTPDIAARVREITIPDGVNVIATYPIAVIDGSDHAPDATAFVRFVTGPGQATLRTFGFLPPS